MRATRGDLAGAIADYGEALRINPGYVEAWNNRGLARRRAGDEAGARADFTRALMVAPPAWPGRRLIERNLAP
jgi:Flp pilus assembly protein TadD